MKLLQQPDDGVMPLVSAIDNAKSSIDMLIFRFDQRQIERALVSAVGRGVAVQALIAHVNSSGAESLRKLEMRMLAAGVTVARTADGLARYHAKLMVIDRSELYLLAFNFTNQDINRSRSFGVVVKDPKLVQEALKLIEADKKRQPYEPGLANFVVSPENARKELTSFLEGAEKELLIYDPKVSDRTMIRLLEERSKAGVEVKIIGQASAKARLATHSLAGVRLHTRAIVRDRQAAFVGSQSLRELELDGRREAGLVLYDSGVVNQLAKRFEEDWEHSKQSPALDTSEPAPPPAAKVAKKVAKAVSKGLPPVAPVLEVTIQELVGDRPEIVLDAAQVEETVRDAVKEAVKEAVKDAVEDAEQSVAR